MAEYHRKVRKKRLSAPEVVDTLRRTKVRQGIDAIEVRTGEVEQQLVYSPPIGSLMPYVGESDPPGGKWMVADGRTISIEDYPDYAAIAGTAFNTGGEPAGHVRLPNTRGRGVVGSGTGTGLTARTRGTSGGAETHVVTTSEMPSHSHTIGDDTHDHTFTDNFVTNYSIANNVRNDSTAQGFMYNPTEAFPNSNSVTHSHTAATAGSGAAHNNMPPWIAMPHIVRVLL